MSLSEWVESRSQLLPCEFYWIEFLSNRVTPPCVYVVGVVVDLFVVGGLGVDFGGQCVAAKIEVCVDGEREVDILRPSFVILACE